MNSDIGPADGGPVDDFRYLALLVDVPLGEIVEGWQADGSPETWQMPARWSRVVLRRVRECAAATGRYDVKLAAVWWALEQREEGVST